MAKSVQKISLSASRDIPFDKLVLSQSNVRHVKAGVSIDELAADIARRTLLQSLTVRPVLDADGAETGMYEIPAGGRRFRALELLVKQKRLAKNTPIPCIVRTEGEKGGYPGLRHSTPKHDNALKYIILLKIKLRHDTLNSPIVFSLMVSIW